MSRFKPFEGGPSVPNHLEAKPVLPQEVVPQAEVVKAFVEVDQERLKREYAKFLKTLTFHSASMAKRRFLGKNQDYSSPAYGKYDHILPGQRRHFGVFDESDVKGSSGVTSRVAADVFDALVVDYAKKQDFFTLESAKSFLKKYFNSLKQKLSSTEGATMTTVSVGVFALGANGEKYLVTGNIGDSGIFIFSNESKELQQATALKESFVGPEAREEHEPDIQVSELKTGDTVIALTDGAMDLQKVQQGLSLKESSMVKLNNLVKENVEPKSLASSLAGKNMFLRKPKDDTTAVVVRVGKL